MSDPAIEADTRAAQAVSMPLQTPRMQSPTPLRTLHRAGIPGGHALALRHGTTRLHHRGARAIDSGGMQDLVRSQGINIRIEPV